MPIIPTEQQLADGWFGTGTDYRGIRIMGMARSIRNSSWYLFTKIDVDEVRSPLNRLTWELALVVGLIALANSAGIGYLWRSEQLQAHRERKAVAGHFDSLARFANDIILLSDDEGCIIEASQRAIQAYGYSAEELQSLHIQALRAPGEPESRALDDAEGVRYEAVHKKRMAACFPST